MMLSYRVVYARLRFCIDRVKICKKCARRYLLDLFIRMKFNLRAIGHLEVRFYRIPRIYLLVWIFFFKPFQFGVINYRTSQKKHPDS